MPASIDIVITTKNRPAYVSEAILSSIQQTTPALSIILIDDGSDTPIENQLDPKLVASCRLIRNDRSGGVSAARNQGVQEATAEWIVFLDDDDWLDPEFVASVNDAIACNSNARGFWPSRRLKNDSTGGTERKLAPSVPIGTNSLTPKLMTSLMETGCSGTVVHRSAFAAVGGFDESLVVSEDRDLTFRMLAAGHLALPVRDAVINIRVHDGPRLSNHERSEVQAKSDLKAIDKNLEFLRKHPVLAEKFMGRAAKRLWERKHLREAQHVLKLLAEIRPFSFRVRQRQIKWWWASKKA